MAYWVCPYGVVNCTVCRAVPASHRVYLAVPYAEKDAAKGIGARWDANKRLWYCDGREGITRFAKWFRTEKNVAVVEQPAEKAAATTIGYNELLDALAAADREKKDVIVEVNYIRNEDKACAYACRLNALLNVTLNKGRREISSVLSKGRYGAEVHDDVLPPYYPANRPHY